MHHLAVNMTELCHSGKHKNVSGESIPMYNSSGEEVKLVVSRGRYLSVYPGMDEFGLAVVWYKMFSYWNGNKVICDLLQHD